DCEHGEVVCGALFIARCDAAELFQAVDQALDPIAKPVGGAIEMGLAALVALAGNDGPDATLPQTAPRRWAAVALVARRPERGIAPRSRTCAKAICSWRSPPVKTAVIGRPWPSARRWILVENPPWDRPSASSGASPPDGAGPASAGGVLVSANDRGIDKVQIPVDFAPRVRLSLKGAEDAVPNPRPTPSVEAARHRSDRAVALRQIAPGGAGAVDPQHAAHHAAVIMIGSARAGLFRRQQRLKSLPLCVRHI